MITKICSRCGKPFHIYDKKYNAKKYCSTCSKPEASIKSCRYCGKPFTTCDNRRKYCSKSCSDKARQDKISEYVHEYYKKYPWKKIKRGLGTSMLKQHCNLDYQKELKQIKAELKRIGLR